MTRWYLAGAGVLILVGLYRTVAIGRKAQQTISEQKAAAWGGMPVKFRRTQPANRWRLMLRRTPERRRSA